MANTCTCSWPEAEHGTPHADDCPIWHDPTPSPANRYMRSLYESAQRATAICLFMQWLLDLVLAAPPVTDRFQRYDC